MRKTLSIICAFCCSLGLFPSCSGIECPVENRVYTLYQGADTLRDTLTVFTHRADGTDTILLNQASYVVSFELPISYQAPVDTLFFRFHRAAVTDTVFVAKTNEPHFESVDCNAAFFHTLQSVTFTRHAIAGLTINNPAVNYEVSSPHFHIQFR